MGNQNKLGIIGGIALLASVIFFFLSDATVAEKGWFASILNIVMAALMLFIFAINFFVLAFLIKKVRKRF